MSKTPINWNKANFAWNNASTKKVPYTWNEVLLIRRAAGEDWNVWEQKDKDKLVKLILKVHGNTITESKRKKIKQYKIKASDIKLTVEKILGIEVMTENIKL